MLRVAGALFCRRSVRLDSVRTLRCSATRERPSVPLANSQCSEWRDPAPLRSVLVSQSHCIFTNLALEHWMFCRHRTAAAASDGGRFTLLLWRNEPCVVLGRHQNPWQETSVSGATVARRASGGGCVYHDLGNVNVSFISERRHYDRAANLQLLVDAIHDRWPAVNVSLNQRLDLVLDQHFKISGSAAKLTRDTAYHHCTLLVNTDLTALNENLAQKQELESNATASVSSLVANLSDVVPDITVQQVMTAVGQRFLQHADTQHNGGCHLVNPSDDWFPGVSAMKQQFSDNEWVYGKTPPFRHTFSVPGLAAARVTVHVQRGRVVDVQMTASHSTPTGSGHCSHVHSASSSLVLECLQGLIGQAYCSDMATRAEQLVLANKTRLQY